jgi:hypothetical protein
MGDRFSKIVVGALLVVLAVYLAPLAVFGFDPAHGRAARQLV